MSAHDQDPPAAPGGSVAAVPAAAPGSPPPVIGEEITNRLALQEDLLRSAHRLMVESRTTLAQLSEESTERQLRPLLLELILLFDSVQQTIVWARSQSPVDTAALVERLDALSAELVEVLFRREVFMQDEIGLLLDRQRHRVVKTVATLNADEDSRIREIVRPGFRLGQRILRPADVVVYRFAPPAQGPGATK